MQGELRPPLSVSEALQIIRQNSPEPGLESLPLTDALHRILAEEIRADRDYPPFHRSAVDGYAIRSEDVSDTPLPFRIIGTVLAGTASQFSPARGECVRIMTGAPVPSGFDSVIMVEEATEADGEVTFRRKSIPPWSNISKRAEDAAIGQLIATRGMAVDPSLVPIAASLGKGRLNVYRAPSIALITTGDEVVRPDQTPLDHQIRDSNSSSIEALLKNFDITLRTKRLVPDSRPIIREAIERGLESDLLIITGGVSMGVADYVPQILSELGVRKVFHKVRVKPGFPLWFGRSANGGAVFGLPGNPVSSQVACRIFVSAYIRRFMGFPDEVPLRLPLAKSKSKKHDREEYAQARLILKEGRTMIEPIRHNGSGDFIHLLGSSGVMVHPAGSPELREGEAVEFHFWRPC